MAKSTKNMSHAPALTVEGHQSMMADIAMREAERRIRDGTASSQLVSIFCTMGTPKYQLELEILEAQKQKVQAQIREIEEHSHFEAKFDEAMASFKVYRGEDDDQY